MQETPTTDSATSRSAYIRELAPTQGEQVLVNQDLHGENVLAAEREPWLVIDPKPLAGEREFSVASIVRSSELGHSKRDVLYRLDRLVRGARPRSRAREGVDDRADDRVVGRQRLRRDAHGDRAVAAGGRMTLRAVLFDVDFTLAQARTGADAGGLRLAAASGTGSRSRRRATRTRATPRSSISSGIPSSTTTRRSGSRSPSGSSSAWAARAPASHDVAVELTSRWQRHENFELYEDVLPVLDELRQAGLKLGLVSNSARDVRDFARHHALEIDAGISSFQHGKTKPHASIFRAVLDLLDVEPGEAAMVGDTVEDDIEGALALGMRAVLVDRLGLREDFEPRIDDLYALPAVLGLTPTL